MDIFSHGLWSSIISQGANLKTDKSKALNPWLSAWWGVFPDLFAFTPIASFVLWERLHGRVIERFAPRMPIAPTGTFHDLTILSHNLYNVSHSAVVFTVVFLLIVLCNWLFLHKRFGWHIVPFEMLFWLLHILTDIPTHTHEFYPTPVLWPISGVTFSGFAWATPWFLVPDYALMIIVYISIVYYRGKQQKM